jgi:integrase
LRADDIKALYAAMRKISRAEDGDRSELLRRLLAARATWRATGSAKTVRRISTRPLTDARIRRVHAVLRASPNDAGLPVNPAAQVRFGKQRKARPLLWTGARVERWRETGEVPGKVMVWTAAQCGAFLDSVEGQRIYVLYHVAAYYGLRRSELCGLTWSEVDLAQRRIHVRQAQVEDVLDSTKSEDSERIIAIDQDTAEVLRAWREAQAAERLAWGQAWQDSGRVFTREGGSPLPPGWVSERFGTLSARAGLPPVTFHGLRHGAATMLLAPASRSR